MTIYHRFIGLLDTFNLAGHVGGSGRCEIECLAWVEGSCILNIGQRIVAFPQESVEDGRGERTNGPEVADRLET